MSDAARPRAGDVVPVTAALADAAARNAAIVLALTIPGDTVLYLLLPLHAEAFGVSLPEAGLLLAANRLVRIFGYGWVARFYARRGPRAACQLAALGAIGSTLGYALLGGVWALLALRLVWGLSFAAQNIANQALPTWLPDGAPRRSGQSRFIISMGSMASLIVGAGVAQVWGPRVVFAALAVVALAAPILAARLPDIPEIVTGQRSGLSRPDAMNVWAFASGLTLDGLFVFGLSLVAAQTFPQTAVLAAGAAMALRYGAEMALARVGGTLAQRHGARRLLIGLALAAAGAMALIGMGWAGAWIGIGLVTVLRALLQPLPAPVVAQANPGTARVPALARQAQWRDIGAAAGPLAAGVVFPLWPAVAVYAGAAVVLGGATLLLMRRREP